MIYYPLCTLMLAGIREILIISTPDDAPLFQKLLGDGSELGLHFDYAMQAKPNGLAEAFIIGEDFVGDCPSALIFGDNIVHGHDLSELLQAANQQSSDATTVFAYSVTDPERYGVVGFDAEGHATSLEEKPKQPRSCYAVTGLYFYDEKVVRIAKEIKPSARGELEITDVNRAYLEQGSLSVVVMGRGIAWLDTGTHESLNSASAFIQTLEKRQGIKVCSPEETAYRMGFIDAEAIRRLDARLEKNAYDQYLNQAVSAQYF